MKNFYKKKYIKIYNRLINFSKLESIVLNDIISGWFLKLNNKNNLYLLH